MKCRFITLAILLLIAIEGRGQDAQADYTVKKRDWGFSITPYALLASQSTDIGGQKLRQSFNDLSSLTNSGFQLATDARYKRIKLSFDGTFAKLGHGTSQPPLLVDLSINQNILNFNAGYMVFESFEFEEDEVLMGWGMTLKIGAKYWKNDVVIDYSLVFNDNVLESGTIKELQDWWDLMVGAGTNFIISKKFMLTVDASVGGFGIGNSSKFAYEFTYMNSFKVTKFMIIDAGFRNFRYRRIEGTGDNELKTTVNVLGPVLGISFII